MARGQRNVYICTQGHHLTTVDLDDGVTPMFIKCRVPIKRPRGALCSERAHSGFYRDPMGGWAAPTHGWYRPSPAERAGLERDLQEHVDNGGLLLRPLLPNDDIPPQPRGKAQVEARRTDAPATRVRRTPPSRNRQP
jgi:hypothetical protein